jgi:tetratricopeptide (TPR) repeat protein
MGEVFLATDQRLGRSVAIKVIAPEVTANALMRGRFEREARAIAALSHPAICALYDVGEQDGVAYMVMEYLEGATLAQRMREPALETDEIVRIASRLCDALAAAHELGIVHRDLKPSNVMITPRGDVKLLDFGVAKIEAPPAGGQEEPTWHKTGPGMLLGTLAYMAPEQACGDGVTPASDLFSLGVVLYEALTGRHPFTGASNRALLHAILSEAPPPIASIRPDVPPQLDSIVLRMLEKEPARRPGAAEARAALAGFAAAPPQPLAIRAPRNLVGRRIEIEELASLLASGPARMVVVTGEAGLGKSTLVESFLDQVRGRALVAVGRCSERLAGAEAYLPFFEALQGVVSRDHSPALRRLAPSWHSQVASGGDDARERDAGPDRMKRELTALFEEITRAKPMILFIDDMHWADISTVDLITYLASRLEALRLSIVVTYRPADLLIQKHPFLQVKQDLQARGICHEIELPFLGETDVAAYIEREFPGNRFPPPFASVIYERTGGSPLFMADLLRYLRSQGVAADPEGRAVLTRDVDEVRRELPESVRGMVERKMGRLSDADLALIRAASVQGMEFESVTLAEALRLDPVEVEERLEQLDRVHRLVRAIAEIELPDATPAMRYRFVHVLYQNASFQGLGPSRRTALSRAVAEALEGRWGNRAAEIAPQLAYLFEAARRFERAAEYLLAAAEHADRVYASQETTSLARRGLAALERAGDEPATAARQGRFNELLGNALARLGNHQEARDAYESALARLSPGDVQRVASIRRKIGSVLVVERRYAEGDAQFVAGEKALEEAEGRGTAWWSLWVEMQLERAWALYWQGDVSALDTLIARVGPSVEENGSVLQRSQFLVIRVLAALRRDRYRISDETLALSAKSVELAMDAGDARQLGASLFQYGFCRMWRNELDEAERYLLTAAEKAEAMEDRVLQSRCYSYLTLTARKRGDSEATARWNAKALEVAQAAGMLEYVGAGFGNAAWIALQGGHRAGAENRARKGLELLVSLPIAHGPLDWIAALPLIAALVEEGRFAEAAEAARVILEPTAHSLPDALQAALGDAVRSCEEGSDASAHFARSLELAQMHRYL